VKRRAAIASVTAGVVLAGLGAGGARGTDPTWHVRTLPHGTSFGEPGLAVGRHGLLVANACTANAGVPASLWRSTDSGRTWSRAVAIGGSAIGCGDADTAIGSDGYEYALVLGTGVSVYRSRDGRRWSGPAAFPPAHGVEQPDRPWLVTVPGRPARVYMFNSEVGGNIVEWTSTDHAATFRGPVLVTGGLNGQAALAIGSRPLVDPAHPSQMRLLYETAGVPGALPPLSSAVVQQFPFTQLWQASSNDGGRTWTNALVMDLATTFHVNTGALGHLLPATAMDANGALYVVLSVQLGSNSETHLYLMHTTRPGHWSAPVRIDRVGASNVYPAIGVTRPGLLYVSWYGSDAPSFAQSTARWHEYVARIGKALAHRLTVTTSAVGPLVHVGAIEQTGAVGSRLGEDWSLRDFQSLVIDRCGQPHVTWASDYSDTGGQVLTATTGAACP